MSQTGARFQSGAILNPVLDAESRLLLAAATVWVNYPSSRRGPADTLPGNGCRLGLPLMLYICQEVAPALA